MNKRSSRRARTSAQPARPDSEMQSAQPDSEMQPVQEALHPLAGGGCVFDGLFWVSVITLFVDAGVNRWSSTQALAALLALLRLLTRVRKRA